ncbi:hypothetical protein [Streptomyces sp. 6N223]|uniref:hypothetical protein n=1 Tax=Streptomyces sp. 6N223 TaxID=3457412 RepID=UPI003FD6BCB4
MPSYDLARDRFRLAHPHLSVLGLLHTREPIDEELAPLREELVEIGLVSAEGEISPVLADLVRVITRPVIQVMVELTGVQGVQTHGALIGEGAAFTFEEWPGTGESEYAQFELATVVFQLARIVGLRQRAREEARPAVLTVESTMGALDSAFAALGAAGAASEARWGSPRPKAGGGRQPGQEPERAALAKIARQVLGTADPGMEETARSVFADLITGMRASWRMTAAWPSAGSGGTGVSSIAVWDCGELGYWHRELPAEPIKEGQIAPDSPLRLVQVPAKRVWKMIGDLLPNRDEIREEPA